MITLINDDGYPVAVNTTGVHSIEDCLNTLNAWNDFTLNRPYVEVVNQDGGRYVLNINEVKTPVMPRAERVAARNPFLIGTPGSFFSTMTISNI